MATPTTASENLPTRLRHIWQDTQELIRFAAIGLSMLMPLLGLGSTGQRPSFQLVSGVLLVAIAYHVFGYVLNDVVDLPVDRLQPQRQKSPLVRGVITPGQAMLIALLQLPLLFGVTMRLGASRSAVIVLGTGILCTIIYDLWGKKTTVPPLTDLIQGVAWAMLVLFGALVTNSPLTPKTWLITAYVALFIVQVNGVPASLRDLETDLTAGLNTTALFLGAKPLPNQGFVLSKSLIGYAVGVQTAVFLTLLPLRYQSSSWLYPLLTYTLFATATAFLYLSLRSGQNRRSFVSSMALYIIFSLLTAVAATLPRMPVTILLLCLFFGFLPLFMSPWWYRILRWSRERLVALSTFNIG